MSEETGKALGFERIVFFSDAVFAIVITLLVLPLTAEFELPDESITFADQLHELWPRIVTFVVSFLVIGQFWLAHHRMFGRIATFDNGLLVLNLIFLLTVSFMPFPAAVLGSYDVDQDRLVVVFYAASLAATSFALTVVWMYAHRRRLLSPAISKRNADDVTVGALTINAAFILSIAAAFVSFLAAVLCWAVLAPLSRAIVGRLRTRT